MKKLIGVILMGFFALHLIGLIYLSANNPDKLSNNSDHFAKKIGMAALVGIAGLGLFLSKDKDEQANLPPNQPANKPQNTDYSGSSYKGGYSGGHNNNENNSNYNNSNYNNSNYNNPPNQANNNSGGEYKGGDLYK